MSMKYWNQIWSTVINFYVSTPKVFLIILCSYQILSLSSLTVSNSEKLAINLIHTRPFTLNKTKLACALTLLHTHLLPTTPFDMFIFYRIKPSLDIQLQYSEFLGQKIEFVPIEDKDWQLPDAALNISTWTARINFNKEFRLVGQFRLLESFRYARALGYRYLLTMDDDAFVITPIEQNLVKIMSQLKLKMAYTNLVQDKAFGLALPELVRYFLVSNHIEPSPLLFQDCAPSNMTGLYSSHEKSNQGWKHTVIFANWFIIDIDFWFSELVQRFVNLTIATGDHIRHRWNEQSVIGMIRLIFVQPTEEKLFDKHTFQYIHKRMNTIPRNMCPVFPNCCP